MDLSATSASDQTAATVTTLNEHFHRPVRPACLDYDPTDYQIRPCEKCGTWWAEIVREPSGRQVVREWHDPSCPVLLEWE